ncbi:hypothetical protein NFI96_018491, partial [Prochilodus magdalenae]
MNEPAKKEGERGNDGKEREAAAADWTLRLVPLPVKVVTPAKQMPSSHIQNPSCNGGPCGIREVVSCYLPRAFRILSPAQHFTSDDEQQQRQLFGIEAPVNLTGWRKHFNSYTLQGRRNWFPGCSATKASIPLPFVIYREMNVIAKLPVESVVGACSRSPGSSDLLCGIATGLLSTVGLLADN